MKFNDPYKVYTAASNIEAHMVVGILETNGIAAFADEDQSGLSLWALGTMTQYHQPNVWVEKSTAQAAAELISGFEEKNRARAHPVEGQSRIEVECEECGKLSYFPDSLDGTTQECSHCHAHVDVGELDWDEDFGVPEE